MQIGAKRLLLKHEVIWIAIAISFVTLPHLFRVPSWVSAVYLGLLSLRLYGNHSNLVVFKQIKWWFRTIISFFALLCFIGVFLSYHRLVGRDPGVALLVILAAFKLLEASTERDAYILISVGYILIVTNFFFNESIPIAVFMMFATVLLTSCFVALNDRHQNLPIKNTLKISSSLLMLSVPVMIVLFIFFPRISSPLWKVPQDAHSGKTGISDKMSPGSISRLSQSDQLAFRIEFIDEIPDKENLYWRGPVLWRTDGRTWTRDETYTKSRKDLEQISDKLFSYHITLEPTNKHWLYALDTVVESDSGFISHDSQLLSKSVNKRKRYKASSSIQLKQVESNLEVLKKATQLPEKHHLKTKALAQSWVDEGLNDRQLIQRALNNFATDEFYYTLQPPLLNDDTVDEFLFETKQGFCEHYASSFVVLMRAAGIPARIVTGYQGATKNPLSNHYNVYQRDAHAWAEVYLENQGWLRVDPTSAVAPERVLQGIEEALPESSPIGFFNLGENSFTSSLIQRLRNNWDMLNYRWNVWVLSYNDERQLQLLNKLGIETFDWLALSTLIIGLFLGLIIVLGLIAFYLLRHPISHPDPASKYYYQFCEKISKFGYTKQDTEGALDFAERLKPHFPELAITINEITNLYTEIRYNSDNSQLGLFKQKVKQFNPSNVIKAS